MKSAGLNVVSPAKIVLFRLRLISSRNARVHGMNSGHPSQSGTFGQPVDAAAMVRTPSRALLGYCGWVLEGVIAVTPGPLS